MTRAVVVAASALAASCAARMFVWPERPTGPAPGAAAAWAEATAACRDARSYSGALGVTGQIGDRRIRGLASARLFVALTDAGDVGLEAYVSGQLVFKLGGTAERAVLLVRDRDRDRVVTAPAADVVEALIGVALGPDRLLGVLTGCLARSTTIDSAQRYADFIEVTVGETVVLLEEQGRRWHPRAGRFGTWQVDYEVDAAGAPRRVRLGSRPGQEPVVRLDLSVEDQEIDAALPPAAFVVNVPDDALPMSVAELRESGPLAPGEPAR